MTKDEALRLALEALKNGKRVRNAEGGTKYQPDLEDKAITAIKAALEAKDEPWENFCDSHCVWTDHHPDCKLAQRTWVGLTDEDIGMCLDAGDGSMSKIISFIEAKLKEKNT